jgi:hypothetical protein
MKEIKNIPTILVVLFLGLLAACAGGPGSARSDMPTSPNLVNEQNGEEEEYELIIIDPGFATWFVTRARPINYYSPSYYETWNQQYVSAWNEKVNQAAYYGTANYPFENRIQYDANEDYGVELNHELFWYFRYIQSRYGARYNFPGFSVRNF